MKKFSSKYIMKNIEALCVVRKALEINVIFILV